MSRYSDAVLALSPVAYWRLGEPSGTVADNAQGNATFDGTYVGSPTLGVTGLLAGDSDTAVTFNGTTQVVTVGGPVTTVVDNWTLAVWMKVPALGVYSCPILVGHGSNEGTPYNGYAIYINTAGKPTITAPGVNTDTSATVLTPEATVFLVGLRRSGTSYIYVNGALDTTGGTYTPYTPTAQTLVGSYSNTGNFGAATPDEPAIWDRALTDGEIAGLYAVGITNAVAAGVATGTGAAYGAFINSALAGLASATGSAYGVTVAPQPPRWACPAEYVVELFSSSASFGPNVKLAELWDLRNLGWSRYDRMPGRGFFTLYQDSPHLSSIIPIITHARITRVAPSGNVEVFNGIVSDYNSTGDDVVFDIYDYVSLLSLSRSGYRTMYPTKAIGTEIVSPEWLLAKNATNSALGFVATGTIEDPLGTDDATPIKTNAQFGLMDQMRLALFYDLTEMGRANTNHHVTFEITRSGTFTFNFWKNKGTLRGIPLVLNGSVSDYQYAPNWAAYRNDLATLGTTVGGGAAEVVKTDPTSAAAFGLRQDVFAIKTLAGVTGAVEADQQQAVAARVLKAALEGSPSLWLTLVPGVIEPFTGFDVNDMMPVEISNGTDSITGSWRVVGIRAMIDEPGERTQLLITKVLA